MSEEIRKKEAEKITKEIQESNQLEELEEMLKKNYVEWKQDGITYKVRKPNFAEQQELREIKVKRHNELRNNPAWKYEEQLIREYEEKGKSIAKLTEQQIELNGKKEQLELQLARFGDVSEKDEKVITDLKLQIFNLLVEINSIALEKADLLSESIESELLVLVNSYTCYLVLEKKEKDNWIRVFKSYEEFMNSKDEKLLGKAGNYLSKIIYRVNSQNE